MANLSRKPTASNPAGETRLIDALATDTEVKLIDEDAISIPDRSAFLPVVYVEGAIAMSSGEHAPQIGLDRYPYRPGLLLSQVMRSLGTRILPTADLKRAFVARKGQADTIAVDLERLLYAYKPEYDLGLEAEDRIVIPHGSLDIFVTGEVTRSAWVNAAALTRLSAAIADLTSPFSSIRDVLVRSAGGDERRFDLFRARRYGEQDQDPFLKPGDTVILSRVQLRVSIAGEVKLPGTYQLLPGEGIKELIERYAEGLLPTARADMANLSRKPTASNPAGETRLIDALATDTEVKLIDEDAISIPDRSAFLPVVYVEGAIAMSSGEHAPQFGLDRYPYRPGLLLSQVMRSLGTRIQPTADLKRAFVARKGRADTIAVDLERLLYAYRPEYDLGLEAEDRIVIPHGSHDIFVTGEVTRSAWVNAAALTRLSSVIEGLATEYSSFRDVMVRTSGGEERRFDLFRARRYGEQDQDPFLKPGDTVILSQVQRRVSIDGQVRSPGSYQLLPTDTLEQVVEVYAQGYTTLADRSRIRLTRLVSTSDSVGESLYLDGTTAIGKSFALMDLDIVNVASMQEFLPIVFFEGAIGDAILEGGAVSASLEVANRIRYAFHPGTRLSSAVLALRNQFTPISDLPKAYLRRAKDDTVIKVNLEDFLHRYDFANDLLLEQNDVIIVPFRQFFVTVAGAVRIPGRYPYVPDRGWEYYVGLAGGAIEELNNGRGQTIQSYEGVRRPLSDYIQPEDRILIPSNSFLYNFGRVASVLTTIISVTSLVLGLVQLSNR
jgi:protein involved in polysaccharide export with SLBB domain